MNSLRPTQEGSLSAVAVIVRHPSPTRLSRQKILSDTVGAATYVKEEYKSQVQSFKARSVLTLTGHLATQAEISRVVTASTGNHGATIAYACRQYRLPLTIGVPVKAGESRVTLINKFGADLEFIGRDLNEAKQLILSRNLPEIDMKLVPIGNGSLIKGIGIAVKAFNPSVEVTGVQSEAAPRMALSFQSGSLLNTEDLDTFATGMAVRVSSTIFPGPDIGGCGRHAASRGSGSSRSCRHFEDPRLHSG